MRRTVLLLGSLMPGLLLLGACGPTDQQKTVALLHQRLHAQLDDAARAGAVTEQDLPDGARVVFPDNPPRTNTEPRAGMIEALLDPGLLQIVLAPSATLPPNEANGRVAAWNQDFSRLPIAGAVLPAENAPVVPAGTAVTVKVVCPHRQGSGYGDGTRQPGCF